MMQAFFQRFVGQEICVHTKSGSVYYGEIKSTRVESVNESEELIVELKSSTAQGGGVFWLRAETIEAIEQK